MACYIYNNLLSILSVLSITIREFSIWAVLSGSWRFCVVYIDNFFITSTQHVMVDGCRGKLGSVLSEVRKAVFWVRYHSSCAPWSFFHTGVISYEDESTFIAVLLFPGVIIAVAETLNRDLGKVSEWCDLWGMNKTPINYWRNCVEGVWWPWYFGQDDATVNFEKHLRSVSRVASQRLVSTLRKSSQVFPDRWLLGKCFRGFVLTVLEYCSSVGCSAADTDLKLLDGVISGVRF